MKISLPRSSFVFFASLFALSSFAGNCCGSSEDIVKAAKESEDRKPLEVTFVGRESGPKTWRELFRKIGFKAVEKGASESLLELYRSVSKPSVAWVTSRYAAICRYASFRHTSRVLDENTLQRLKKLLDRAAVNACTTGCNCEDYRVITARLQECVEYVRHRLEVALDEYRRALRGTSLSLFQRTVGLIASRYPVEDIVQILEWMIADLDALKTNSQYTKGFDVEHYKKVIGYFQADLDTLFRSLEPLV